MNGNESDLHVLTLLDQVMYLVVYGNRTDLDERIPPAERDGFFEGLVSSASDLRANYARSWKARRRIQKTRRQSGPLRCLSRFNRSDDEDEDEDKDGEGQAVGKRVKSKIAVKMRLLVNLAERKRISRAATKPRTAMNQQRHSTKVTEFFNVFTRH